MAPPPIRRGDAGWGALAVHLVAMAAFWGGVCLLGWQGVHWLRTGVWDAWSVLDLLRAAGLAREWVMAPVHAIGLWKLLDWAPAAVAGVLVGGGLLATGARDA